MAWVKVVPENEATGLVKEIYEENERGQHTAEIIKVFSLFPKLLDVRRRFSKVITFGGSGLGRYREELIALSLSGLLQCRY